MTEPPAHRDPDVGTDPGIDMRPGARSPDQGTPRWVKVFGIVALMLIALFIIVHLSGGGFGRHMP